MNSVHFTNEDDREDYKTVVCVLSGRNTLGGQTWTEKTMHFSVQKKEWKAY